jgi:hypothetical protein
MGVLLIGRCKIADFFSQKRTLVLVFVSFFFLFSSQNYSYHHYDFFLPISKHSSFFVSFFFPVFGTEG